MSKEIKEILDKIKNTGVSIRKISKELKIPEQRIYGWYNKGASPKHEDVQKLKMYLGMEATNQNQIKPPSGDEAVIAVLISRVAELLADKNGTSSVVESQKMKKDAESLRDMS